DDNDRTYRTEQELKEMRNTDCLLRFRTYLEELNILTEEKNEKITEQIKTEINEAKDYTEKDTHPDPATIKDYVYEMQGGESYDYFLFTSNNGSDAGRIRKR